MDALLDYQISLRDIWNWLHTPLGRLFAQGVLVFMLAEAGRLFSVTIIDALTKMPIKKIRALAEIFGYSVNIVVSCISSFFLFFMEGWFEVLENAWWIALISVATHAIYVSVLKRLLKNKLDSMEKK